MKFSGKQVKINRFYQPNCTACDWLGDQTDVLQEAKDAREEHIEDHRAGRA